MFHGGTSFGFQSGANNGGYLPRPTTYDVDALLDEAGDPNEKYFVVKDIISKVKKEINCCLLLVINFQLFLFFSVFPSGKFQP